MTLMTLMTIMTANLINIHYNQAFSNCLFKIVLMKVRFYSL